MTNTPTQVTVPPTTAGPTYSSASLYVGDLNRDVTEALLFDIFSAVGQVASVRVCRDAQTRHSLGYGYVNFHRVEDAERALDTMNFTNIRGRNCRIMWSHRDPTLRRSGAGNVVVKNLAPSIDNKALFDTFSVFGNIMSCKVATDRDGNSLGYGFVHYENEDGANEAVNRVNNMAIADQVVTVEHFKSRHDRSAQKQNFTNCYVKNLPEDFSEEKLRELFAPHGNVTSVLCVLNEEKKCKGYGFANMASPAEAQAAVTALNGIEVGDKKLYVGRAQNKLEREKQLRENFDQYRQEQAKKYAGTNLYIKNLADSVDKDRIIQEFSKFGDITSARVMADGDKSRGFGFVCFSNAEDATKAVSAMNGYMLEGKPLYVALAQRKDVRRAQLEQQYAQRAKMGPPPMYAQGPMGFYPPVNRMMYGQMMPGGPRRWNPQAQVQRGGPMGMPLSYMNVVPPNGARGGAAAGRGGRGGARGGPAAGGGKGGKGMPGAPQGAGRGGARGGNAPFKYTAQARNNAGRGDANGASSPLASGNRGGPLQDLVQQLATQDPGQQKHTIGEHLYPLVEQREPDMASKITGMLLEMDNGELFNLLESPEALQEKINEALAVLHQHHMGSVGGAEEASVQNASM